MSSRVPTAFLALILAQAAHSIEEYVYRLYDVFGPARFVSGLFSDDLRVGFATANVALVLFGLWCAFARVRPRHRSAEVWVWLWTFLELGNGMGHIAFAVSRGTYFPGVATAPVLLAVSAFLCVEMTRRAHSHDRDAGAPGSGDERDGP